MTIHFCSGAIDGERVTIHFDGWTSKYDYVTTMADPELHPVGWFAQCGRNNKKLTPQLQAPKGHVTLVSL